MNTTPTFYQTELFAMLGVHKCEGIEQLVDTCDKADFSEQALLQLEMLDKITAGNIEVSEVSEGQILLQQVPLSGQHPYSLVVYPGGKEAQYDLTADPVTFAIDVEQAAGYTSIVSGGECIAIWKDSAVHKRRD